MLSAVQLLFSPLHRTLPEAGVVSFRNSQASFVDNKCTPLLPGGKELRGSG